mgnify:CR=1 FL=1
MAAAEGVAAEGVAAYSFDLVVRQHIAVLLLYCYDSFDYYFLWIPDLTIYLDSSSYAYPDLSICLCYCYKRVVPYSPRRRRRRHDL